MFRYSLLGGYLYLSTKLQKICVFAKEKTNKKHIFFLLISQKYQIYH